jgi:sarcosine oxidase, subunit gamma
VSAPESAVPGGSVAGLSLASLPADIIELAALRERTQVLKALAGRRGLAFPAVGWIAAARDTLLLCVRPDRWLLLTVPAPPGSTLSLWRAPCSGCAAVVELSSGLTALHLTGPAVSDVLARGCRLDLYPEAFVPGSAAATSMAQVSVILARLPAGGWLLLTPSSTARHLREWLATTARPFGWLERGDVNVAALSGEGTA